MSKSKKKFPGGTCCCCKSQKRGKTVASKRFRRRSRMLIQQERYEHLPLKSIELTSPWDLGGDGKGYHHGEPTEEWFIKMMRK